VAINLGNVWQVTADRAAATPALLLAVDDHGRTMTFAEFRDRCERTAAGLASMGVTAGTRVSWQLPTNFESMVLCVALARLEAVQNPIIPIYREREVGFCLRQTEAEMMIVPGEFRGFDFTAMANELAADMPDCTVVTLAPGELPDGDPANLPTVPVIAAEQGDYPARWIYYTSGTTSDPKGAIHTDFTVMTEAQTMVDALSLSEDDNWPLVFPFTHIGGIGLLLASLIAGPKLLVTDTFNPTETTAFLSANDMTVGGSGAYFFMGYLAEQARQPDTPLFPNLRATTGGGSAKPKGLHARVKNELGGGGISSSYGLTEIPIVTFAMPGDDEWSLDTTEGRAVPGYDFKFVDLDENPVPDGTEGQILVRGPSRCLGYLDERLNAAAFDDEGYFRTGDLGVRNPEGYIAITGRVKDVIIRNGENISAKAVEDLLFSHPLVAEVAAIGLPDERTGERCCAVVSLKDADQSLTVEDVRAFLIDKGLMRQMIPEQVETVQVLPRNPAGKVLKKDLRARFSSAEAE